jgi:hypothetical protein
VRPTEAVAGRVSLLSTVFDLSEVGYRAEEYFVDGSATRYALRGEGGDDGRWDAEPAGTAPFRTRLVVYRPEEPARFNGTALVEWLNVSSGADVPAVWLTAHRHLLRAGFAWVGVSAQHAGVDGDGGVLSEGAGWRPRLPSLKSGDPRRYASLAHPGDDYAFDIFTQAGQLLPDGLLGPLTADRVLAVGQSQSASFLVTYVNAVAPLRGTYDGYLIHGRPGTPAALSGGDGRVRAGRVRIRPDTSAPVLIVQSETDVVGVLAALGSRQPDTDRLRLWEIAGAAHADTYTINAAFRDSGRLTPAELARLLEPSAEPFGVRFPAPINGGPQQHYVVQAAIGALDRWVRHGIPPQTAPRLVTSPDEPATLRVDDLGIALGGVRTPWVDVPVTVLSGLGQNQSDASALFGSTRRLDPATLAAHYPGGRADYLAAFTRATEEAIDARFLLAEDRDEILALAALGFPA